MKFSARIGRIILCGAATAAFAIAVPVAGAADDGSLLSRTSEQALLQTAGRQVTDDGTLLSRASRQAALREIARINPGRVTDGMLLTEAALLHELAQLNPGHGTGESIISQLAAAPTPAAGGAGQGGFDWGDAAAGFGVGAFGAMLLAAVGLVVRRRGTLVHVP